MSVSLSLTSRFPVLSPAVFLTISLLPGCAIHDRIEGNARVATDADQQVHQQRDRFKDATSNRQARIDAQRVNKPWLVGRSVPLSRDVTLPPALRANVDTTLMFGAGKVGLLTIAEHITRATGVPVRVKPDALLPAENFLPRLVIAQPAVSGDESRQVTFGRRGPQPLPQALDALARHLGIYWRYHDGAIEFYRTQTRVFDVRVLSLSAQADAHLGRSAGNKAGGFDNTSRTSLNVPEYQAMDAIKARIEPFLTRAAIVAAHPGAASSIIVTDTPDALSEVAQFIERENRALTRRVRLIFEEITIATHENLEFGVDWDVVMSTASLTAALSGTPFGAAAPAKNATAKVAQGTFGSSQALMTVLAKYGTVVRHTSVPVLTLNRRPVTHAVRTTFSYIDRVQTTSMVGSVSKEGVGAIPSVSVSQKEETVGAFLTLVPDAQEDGQILLSLAYDNTVAQPLKTVTFGEQSNQAQIQQITIDGNGTVQQLVLKAGQPMLISGFERKHQESTHNRVSADASLILGGGDRTNQSRTATLIIVTAQLEEGF